MGKSSGMQGCAGRENPRADAQCIEAAVHRAHEAGFRVGQPVSLGVVQGFVLGYNISRRGRFPGARYPLLVATGFGVVKCRLEEVRLA